MYRVQTVAGEYEAATKEKLMQETEDNCCKKEVLRRQKRMGPGAQMRSAR